MYFVHHNYAWILYLIFISEIMFMQVVMQQPRAVMVRGQPSATGKSFLGCSIACLVLSVLFFWPSLICSVPAVICSAMVRKSLLCKYTSSYIRELRVLCASRVCLYALYNPVGL